ncbi:hypothetical protein [Actinoplanes sp. NPDC051494]|uniref:hypothetical protein n=1 Tax=Actinoplanes sp. NPDC051494 TaxID=3363907 RepID=UPI0037ACA520
MDETGQNGDAGTAEGGTGADSRDRSLLNGWAARENSWSNAGTALDAETDIPAWRRPATEVRPYAREPRTPPPPGFQPAPDADTPLAGSFPVDLPPGTGPAPRWSDRSARYSDLLNHLSPHGENKSSNGSNGRARPDPFAPELLRGDETTYDATPPASAPPYPYEGDLEWAPHESARHALEPTPAAGLPRVPVVTDESRSGDQRLNRPSYDPSSFPRRLPYESPLPVYPRPGDPVADNPVEPTFPALPQRVPAQPDVPTVPEPPSVEPSAETPALARIATHLRRDDVLSPSQERHEGFDVNAILEAVREVDGVRDAALRTTPAGAHSLRLDLAEGADPAEVSRQVARLLQDRMGLDAAMQGALPMGGMPMGGPPPANSPLTGSPLTGSPLSGSPLSGPPLGGPPLGGPPLGGPPLGGPPMPGGPASAPRSAPPASGQPIIAPRSAPPARPVSSPVRPVSPSVSSPAAQASAPPAAPSVMRPDTAPTRQAPGLGRPETGSGLGRQDSAAGLGRPDSGSGLGRSEAGAGLGRQDPAAGFGRPETGSGLGRQDAGAGLGRSDNGSGLGRSDNGSGLGRQGADGGGQGLDVGPDRDDPATARQVATSARQASALQAPARQASAPARPAATPEPFTPEPAGRALPKRSPTSGSENTAPGQDGRAPRPLLGPGSRPGPRVMIENVQVNTFGTEATVKVRLVVDGQIAAGEATGPAVDAYLLRLCATATANAVDQLLTRSEHVDGPAKCFVEHAAAVPFGSSQVAVVVVLLATDGWVEQLAGSAIVAGDDRHAMVRATLAAVNRRLEALLS